MTAIIDYTTSSSSWTVSTATFTVDTAKTVWETSTNGEDWTPVTSANFDASSYANGYVRVTVTNTDKSQSEQACAFVSSSTVTVLPTSGANVDLQVAFDADHTELANPSDVNVANLSALGFSGTPSVKAIEGVEGVSPPKLEFKDGSNVVYTVLKNADGSYAVTDNTHTTTLIGFDGIFFDGKQYQLQTEVNMPQSSGPIQVNGTPWHESLPIDLAAGNVVDASGWTDVAAAGKVLYASGGTTPLISVTASDQAGYEFKVEVSPTGNGTASSTNTPTIYYVHSIDALNVSVNNIAQAGNTTLNLTAPVTEAELPFESNHFDYFDLVSTDATVGPDTISGSGVRDWIEGSTGADVLTGGAGQDVFAFSTADSGSLAGFDGSTNKSVAGLDVINDFSAAERDIILLWDASTEAPLVLDQVTQNGPPTIGKYSILNGDYSAGEFTPSGDGVSGKDSLIMMTDANGTTGVVVLGAELTGNDINRVPPEAWSEDVGADGIPDIVGYADVGSTVTVSTAGGSVVGTTTVTANDGSYSVALGTDAAADDSGTYIVSASDTNGFTQPRFEISVVDTGVTPPAGSTTTTAANEIWGDDGVYFATDHDTLQFRVNFDNNGLSVTAGGTAPTLTLQIGANTRTASFVEVNNGSELVFEYTLVDADEGALSMGKVLDPSGNIKSSNADVVDLSIGAAGNYASTYVYSSITAIDGTTYTTPSAGGVYLVNDVVSDVAALMADTTFGAAAASSDREILGVGIQNTAGGQFSFTKSVSGTVTTVAIDLDGSSTGWSFTFDSSNSAITVTGGGSTQTLAGIDGLAFVSTDGSGSFLSQESVAYFGLNSRTFTEANWTDNNSRFYNHEIMGSVFDDVLNASDTGTGAQSLDVGTPVAGGVQIEGDLGNDNITGSAGDDWINGGLGNDTIAAGEGDDDIDMTPGTDTVNGGGGFDTLQIFENTGNVDFANLSSVSRSFVAADNALHVQVLKGGQFVDAYVVTKGGASNLFNVTYEKYAGSTTALTDVERLTWHDDETWHNVSLIQGENKQWGSYEGTPWGDNINIMDFDITGSSNYWVSAGEGDDTVTLKLASGVTLAAANANQAVIAGTTYDLTSSFSSNSGSWMTLGGESFAGVEHLVITDFTGTTTLNFDARTLARSVSAIDGDDSFADARGTADNAEEVWLDATRGLVGGARILDGKGGDDKLFGTDDDGAPEKLLGGLGKDELNGLGGHNFLDGGADVDAVSYRHSNHGVKVDVFHTSEQNTGVSFDTILNVENLIGSVYSDTLGGNGWSNGLEGGAGDDVLDGGRGNDDLHGGDGRDYINGGLGNDVLDGGWGADVLYGGIGADTFVFDASIINSGDRSVDRIMDFNVFADHIELINASSASATLSYNSATAEVSYDADGTGTASAAQVIAVLQMSGLTLTADHLVVDQSGFVV